MHRSTQVFLVAGGLLAVTLAASIVPGQVPEIALTDAPGADHVTLYQNGLAFVEVNRTIETAGGEALLTLSLPTTARFESLRVEGDGVAVKEVRSALSATGPLQAGDEVVVRTTADATYEGTYLGAQEGALAIATAEGVALVRPEQVVAVEVRGARAEATTPGAVEASVLVEAPAGQRQVRVTYLAQGPGWTPSYDLDVETGALSFHAVLTGLHDWANVTLDLVSGAPHVVLSPVPMPSAMPFEARMAMDEAAAGEARGADTVAPPETLGDLHRYRVQEPVDLRRGETVRLLVEEGRIDVERRYYEARADIGFGYAPGHEQTVPVLDRLELRNTLGEPLPPGVVLAYRGGTWIGEDRLDATRENGTANLTLARSQDVTARLVLERSDATRGSDVATYALVVENGRDEEIDLRATLQYPPHRTRLVDAQPAPSQTRGTALTWDLAVPAGDSARVAVTVETLVDEGTPVPPPMPVAEGRSAGGSASGSGAAEVAPQPAKEEPVPVATG